jgi:hypothetical protein
MTRLLRRLPGLVRWALGRRLTTSVAWIGGSVGAWGAEGNWVDAEQRLHGDCRSSARNGEGRARFARRLTWGWTVLGDWCTLGERVASYPA